MESLGMNKHFWRDRPCLVTGASGLVGGWLVKRLLAAGADLICLVRDNVPHAELSAAGLADRVVTVTGDVVDQALLERVLGEYEIETVFHLAAQTIVGIAGRNPVSTFESNVRGTWALLEACRRSPRVGQIVVASSDKAYGDQSELPYTESAPLLGRAPYDASKACADIIAQSYAASFELPVAITRCGNFYGGGDLNWNRIVPGTIRSVVRGERPVIRTDGLFVRDYFYVEDGAAAYMRLAEHLAEHPEARGEGFNFSNEEPLTVLDITRRVLSVMDSDLEPLVQSQPCREIRKQYLSADKARNQLSWRPLFSLDEGLAQTVAWYRDFFAAKGLA